MVTAALPSGGRLSPLPLSSKSSGAVRSSYYRDSSGITLGIGNGNPAVRLPDGSPAGRAGGTVYFRDGDSRVVRPVNNSAITGKNTEEDAVSTVNLPDVNRQKFNIPGSEPAAERRFVPSASAAGKSVKKDDKSAETESKSPPVETSVSDKPGDKKTSPVKVSEETLKADEKREMISPETAADKTSETKSATDGVPKEKNNAVKQQK